MRARELLRRLGDPAEPEVADLGSASLAAAVSGLVRSGRLPAGVELPSERDLAAALGRSRGTVARAYEQLRADGLAHTRHGAGTTIGCCAGPWASSRAAELDNVLPVLAGRMLPVAKRVIDLRWPDWPAAAAPHSAERPDSAGEPAVDPAGALRGALADRLAASGAEAAPEQLLLVDGAVRGLEVVLATLARPGERVLVPALTDPRVLALLQVRGLHPVALPVDADGSADLPGWLQRLRARSAPIAVLAATHAAPSGTILRAHERRLLVEAAAAADVTLVDDLTQSELWLEARPPAALASFDTDDLTVTFASTSASAPPGTSIGWVHTASAVLEERLRSVASAIDAAPADPAVAAALGAEGERGRVLEQRRQHLIDRTAATIRVVTPVAPQVSVGTAAGGPFRLLHLGGVPGQEVAEAARERGVLVHAGAVCSVGADDPSVVALSLTAPIEDVVTGVRVVIEVVRELA